MALRFSHGGTEVTEDRLEGNAANLHSLAVLSIIILEIDGLPPFPPFLRVNVLGGTQIADPC
jgi:hypothetical protein